MGAGNERIQPLATWIKLLGSRVARFQSLTPRIQGRSPILLYMAIPVSPEGTGQTLGTYRILFQDSGTQHTWHLGSLSSETIK